MMCLTAQAQHSGKDYTPRKGDFTLAATVGYNSYASVTAQPGTLATYEGAALSQKLNRGIILYRRLPARSGMGQLKPDAGG